MCTILSLFVSSQRIKLVCVYTLCVVCRKLLNGPWDKTRTLGGGNEHTFVHIQVKIILQNYVLPNQTSTGINTSKTKVSSTTPAGFCVFKGALWYKVSKIPQSTGNTYWTWKYISAVFRRNICERSE